MTGAEGHVGFFADAANWVAISTVLFGVVLYKYARKPFFNLLDNRTEKIRDELNEAERLRVEAQELLASYQRQHQDALQEAEQIIIGAQKEANNLKTTAEKELQQSIERKHKQFEERVQRMEQTAIENVRNKIIELSMQATEKALKEAVANKKSCADDLTNKSIESLAEGISKAA